MKINYAILVGLGLTLLCNCTFGEDPVDPIDLAQAQLGAEVVTQGQPWANAELGISIGTPGVLNYHLGLWGNGPVALVARVSGGFVELRSGEQAAGVEATLGYQIIRRSNFRLFSGISLSTLYNNIGPQESWTGIGPVLGFYLSGFHLSSGVSFGYGKTGRDADSPRIRHHRPQLMFQVGYSFLL